MPRIFPSCIIRPLPLRFRCVAALAWLGAVVAQSGHAQSAPRASADGEVFEGVALAAPARGAVFRGIPYAAAPVGELRWRPPARHQPGRGVRPAREFAASCMQDDRINQWALQIYQAFGRGGEVRFPERRVSEDCLFLNVWTGNLGGRAPAQPVMLWIHGGSNIGGGTTTPWTDGARLAARGVVVVTLNYRLGVFGFLAHPALSAESPDGVSGNYGLRDQLEALRWVQRNIASFGGDPARVTVFGESAGGVDITALLAAPASEGLFQRAIIESGAQVGALPRLAQAERSGIRVLAAAGIDSTAGSAELRAAPAESLLAAATRAGIGFNPAVDGKLIREVPGRALEQGLARRVPLLVGSNARELTTLRSFLPPFERSVAGYRTWLATMGPLAGPLEALYPAADAAAVEPAVIDLLTDLLFSCGSRFAARAMAATGTPAYQYYFSRVLPNGGERLGAFHGMEIAYVFGNLDPLLPSDATDRRLSEAMQEYWTRFAATGDPNGGALPRWPAYRAATDGYLELGAEIRAGSKLKPETCRQADVAFRFQWGPPVR